MDSLDWDGAKRQLRRAVEIHPGVAVADRLKAGGRTALDATAERAAQVVAAAQALLASDLSSELNNLAAAAVNGSATIYDKAMDANYLDPLLRPGLGGSYHRLFDGGHTIAGAVRAARDASPDDTIVEEALGTVQALLRDAATPRGLPLATWDKSTFDAVAGSLESTFAIPKSWFYDLNTYDAADLLGASVGVVAVVLGWNRADTETFASLTASMGLSAAVGANPLLLVVVVVAAAKAFHKARPGGEYTELVDGGFKGAVGSGATLAAVALVGSAGGPAGVALLVGITTGIVASSATKNVSLTAIGRFVAEREAPRRALGGPQHRYNDRRGGLGLGPQRSAPPPSRHQVLGVVGGRHPPAPTWGLAVLPVDAGPDMGARGATGRCRPRPVGGARRPVAPGPAPGPGRWQRWCPTPACGRCRRNRAR